LLGTAWYHSTPDLLMSDLYNAGNTDQAFVVGLLRLMVCVPLILLLSAGMGSSPAMDHRIRRCECEPYRLREHGVWWLLYGLFVACLTVVPLVTLLISSCTAPVGRFLCGVACGGVDVTLTIPVRVVIGNSLVLALVSSIFTVVIAGVLNFFARRVQGKVSARLMVIITVLPFLLGSVGIGMLFAWFSCGKAVSAFMIGALCHLVLNYPFAYRVISAQFELYHPDMMRSAQSMGASSWHAVRTVLLPFARSSFVAAFVVAFGLSLTEVGAGSVLQGTMGMTMPMAIHAYRKAGQQDAVLGLSMILMLLVLGVSLFLSRWAKK
jgi:ABC-type Fe3+ transport system permease subunit